MSSDAPVDLRLLGAMEACVRGAGGDRRLGKGKPVALLAYLSLSPGRRASRERLATLLWSDGSSEAARQNLRQTLWYLKRRLGDVVQADDDHVALRPGATSDVERFTRATSAERYDEAIGAYLGDFVPDFAAPGAAAFEEWADLERRRLRATFVGCAEALARRQLADGHAADAVRLARRVRELAPEDPNAWRLLLEALVAARDALGAAAAVAQLEAEIARDELEPDPAVRSLLRAARKLASGHDTEGGSADAADASLVPDLIGREPEFRTLVDAWEGARRGRGRALLVSGAAGLGKTRLLSDFAARVISTRGRTVQVRAHPGNRTISGSLAALIAEGLAALPGSAAISPGSASVLVALSPLLASAFRGAEPDRSAGDDATRRRVAALGELIGLLTETTPLALLVDDAHWADAESMRIVGALRGKVEESRAVLVTASRLPDDLRAQMGGVEELALRPLDVAGVAEFVGRLAAVPTEPWSRHFVTRLHEVTHGIPLLLIETLQRLVEDGVLARADGQWHATSADAVAQALPNESALIARLKSLSSAERTALVRLATIGRPVSPATLPPAPEHGAWDGVLTALERRSFVARTERTVSVWHDEVARGVLELATPEERLAAHAWVSDALAERASTMAEYSLAALHASRAADEGRLRRVWLAALGFAREGGDARPAAVIAREVLGTEASGEQVQAMVRSTPWGLRAGRLMRGIAAAAVLMLLAFGVGRWPRTPGAGTLTIYLAYEADTSKVVQLAVARSAEWRDGEPLDGTLVPSSGSPVSFAYRTRELFRVPGRREWVGVRTFPDSGGDEWIRVSADGRVQRLSNRPGDDWMLLPLADGRGFVGSSRSFDRREHQAEIVRTDAAGRTVALIGSSVDDEMHPSPSPDGTRIAFTRRYTSRVDSDELCVGGIDGVETRCRWDGLDAEELTIAGWPDARSVLVQDPGTHALFLVDVDGGTATRLGEAACTLTPFSVRGLALANCLDAQTRERYFGLAPLAAPRQVRPILVEGRRISAFFTAAFVDGDVPAARYLDRVSLVGPDSALPTGATGVARLIGFDQDGGRIEVFATRFWSSSPAILMVERDGTLRARAPGRAWLHGTAGGWRSDSILVEVRRVTVASAPLLREHWSDGLSLRWRTFGHPRPLLGAVDDRRVLLPNGDGVYESGVISRAMWSPRAGLGIQVEAWMPISRPKLQRLVLTLTDGPSDDAVDGWVEGQPPGQATFVPLCGSSFPAGEGARAFKSLHVSADAGSTRATVPLTDHEAFYRPTWRRVRIQLFPDGRCGLAIDGQAIVRTSEVRPLPQRARVMLLGASVGTTIAIGNVEVWEGVREDVRWP